VSFLGRPNMTRGPGRRCALLTGQLYRGSTAHADSAAGMLGRGVVRWAWVANAIDAWPTFAVQRSTINDQRLSEQEETCRTLKENSNHLILATSMIVSLRRDLISATVLVATAAAPALQVMAQSALKKHKVVFQVSDCDPQRRTLALHNIPNVVDALGAGNVEMELLLYGLAIDLLKSNSPVGKRTAPTLAYGVHVVAFENTMKAQNLVHANMLADIRYVAAGVGRVDGKAATRVCLPALSAVQWLSLFD